MAQRVIHFLEPVQIDEQQGQRAALASCTFQLFGQAVAQQAQIGQAGQRVVIGFAPDGLLHLFAFADIQYQANQPAQAAIRLVKSGFVEHHVVPAAIGILHLRLIHLRATTVEQALVCRVIARGKVWRRQVEYRIANQLLARGADELLECDITTDVATHFILVENRVRNGIDQPGDELQLVFHARSAYCARSHPSACR
jgi:hypothetical protein